MQAVAGMPPVLVISTLYFIAMQELTHAVAGSVLKKIIMLSGKKIQMTHSELSYDSDSMSSGKRISMHSYNDSGQETINAESGKQDN